MHNIMKMWCWKAILLAVSAEFLLVESFQQSMSISRQQHSIHHCRSHSSSQSLSQLWNGNDDKNDEDKVVEVGSKEYLEGFLSSPIQDESVAERGSGLEQALKLGGGVTAVLVLLVVGFLASNGLI